MASPKPDTAQGAFWAIDAHRMEKVVTNFAGEIELEPGNPLRDSLELGSIVEFTCRAQVTGRKFTLKGTGSAIMTVLGITVDGGDEVLTTKAKRDADTNEPVSMEERKAQRERAARVANPNADSELPKRGRGRPKKADPVFDAPIPDAPEGVISDDMAEAMREASKALDED